MNEDDPGRATDNEQLAEAAAHKKTILIQILKIQSSDRFTHFPDLFISID